MSSDEHKEDEDKMPFTEHTSEELSGILQSIVSCGLPVEVFDAFLYHYFKTGDLQDSRFFAMCEWDC